MNSQYLETSVVVFLVITTSICLAVIGPIADDDLPSVVKGGNQVLQNAFGEILQRRRRASSSHDQVVKISFSKKENKSIRALSQEEKDYLVHIHNAYRSAVQPYAANMLELVWDEEIAAFAQDWADQCKGAHRPNRDLSPWINMGENIFWAFGGKYHEGMSAKFWWDEVQWYNFTDKSCIKGKMCGHYVTMVWAASGRMGCGVARCPRLAALQDIGMGAYYFVCNYNGRFFSHTQPYREHLSICSFCFRTQAPKCRYNLCVTQEMLDYDIGYNGSTVEIGFNRTKTHSSRKSPTTPSPTHSTSNQISSQLTTSHSTTSPSRTTTQSTLASSQRSTEVTSNDNTTITSSVVVSTTDTPRVTTPYSTSTAQTNADSTTTTSTTTTATTSSKGETTTTTDLFTTRNTNGGVSTNSSTAATTNLTSQSTLAPSQRSTKVTSNDNTTTTIKSSVVVSTTDTSRVTFPYSSSTAQTNADSTTTTTSTTTATTSSAKGDSSTTANEYSSTTKSAWPTTKPATTKAVTVIDEFPIKKGESFLMDVVREAVLNTGNKASPTLIQAAFSLITSILIRILRVS